MMIKNYYLPWGVSVLSTGKLIVDVLKKLEWVTCGACSVLSSFVVKCILEEDFVVSVDRSGDPLVVHCKVWVDDFGVDGEVWGNDLVTVVVENVVRGYDLLVRVGPIGDDELITAVLLGVGLVVGVDIWAKVSGTSAVCNGTTDTFSTRED